MAIPLGVTRWVGLLAFLVCIGSETVTGTAKLDVIDLPMGFYPEGIALGENSTAFVGSLADGSIWKGDLLTGVGEVVVPGDGGMTIGLNHDKRSGYLFAAAGTSGARVYDDQFDLVAEYAFKSAYTTTSLVNDVIVTKTSAYFTDSYQAKVYSVKLDEHTGELANGPEHSPETIALSSNFPVVEGQVNANGIEANDDGSMIIVSNTFAGELFTVDPETGDAAAINLGGVVVPGDGLVLRKNTLWVVDAGFTGGPQRIIEVSLSPDFSCGSVAPRVLTSELFDMPTTAARMGNSLYVVSAKFGVPEEDRPTTAYEIVRVDRDSGEFNCTAV